MDSFYFQVFIQWAFFFELVALFLLPAFRFRKIALQYGKKGWQYFLFGLGLGLAWSIVLRWIFYMLVQTVQLPDEPDDLRTLISFAVLTFCLAGAYITVGYAARNMKSPSA
jgi:hypothetical protein